MPKHTNDNLSFSFWNATDLRPWKAFSTPMLSCLRVLTRGRTWKWPIGRTFWSHFSVAGFLFAEIGQGLTTVFPRQRRKRKMQSFIAGQQDPEPSVRNGDDNRDDEKVSMVTALCGHS